MMKGLLQSTLWNFLVLLLFVSFFESTSACQTLSDDQLIRMGKAASDGYDFPRAAVYLYAYMQRNPPLMASHPDFAKQVLDVYQNAMNEVKWAFQERDQLKVQLAKAQSESEVGMTTSGLTRQPPPLNIPEDSGKSARPKGAYIGAVKGAMVATNPIGGAWKYKTTSKVANDSHEGFLKLSLDGTLVKGSISTWDKSAGTLQGTFSGDTLEMERDTGLATIQHYRLSKQGDDRMTGVFWNTGKYSDSGAIEMVRVK
jgi:hypothetical protein